MAKFSGRIGFGIQKEIQPGIWDNVIEERPYYGDVVRETLEKLAGETVLGDIRTANSFRIVADPYAEQNFMDMKYLRWNGRVWVIRQVELQSRPRLLIRIGGIYEGPTEVTGTPGDDSGD